ncbi:MAG: DUF1385 domain-containing protein [Bacillota bacterium]|nr:DUF1385 domain-containing protein [Bacillota bacterium]
MAVIGGRAHINGITFATNTHVVRGKLKNGELTVYVQRLPEYAIIKAMDKIPFVRGISKLAKINLKLFLMIVIILATPWDWIFPSGQVETSSIDWYVLGIYILVLIAAVFLLKRLWQYHGAEHKAFNIYTSGNEFLLESVIRADRVSDRCGTNLVVILLPIMFLLSFVLGNFPLLLYLLSISVGYEIFNWSSRKQRLRIVFAIAAIIQKYIVTAEPTEEQIQLAIATIRKAIETEKQALM